MPFLGFAVNFSKSGLNGPTSALQKNTLYQVQYKQNDV